MKLIYTLILFFLVLETQAQDLIFSNYSYAGYHINPALPSLMENDFQVQTKFRGQWNTFSKAFKTIAVSADFSPLNNDSRFCGKKLTVSPQIIQDIAGSLKMSITSLNLNIAYSQFLDRNYRTQLMLGLQSGYSFRSIDLSRAVVGSKFINSGETIDVSDPYLLPKSNYINLGVGAGMAFYPNRRMNYSLGFSAYNLLGQNVSFLSNGETKELRRFVGYFNSNIQMNDINSLNTFLIFQAQGPFKSYFGGFTWGVNFGKQEMGEFVNQLFFGGGLRWNDAVVGTFGYGNQNFSLAFNYDFNYSKLIKASRSVGAFEISLAFKTDWTKQDKNCPRPINCVTFR